MAVGCMLPWQRKLLCPIAVLAGWMLQEMLLLTGTRTGDVHLAVCRLWCSSLHLPVMGTHWSLRVMCYDVTGPDGGAVGCW